MENPIYLLLFFREKHFISLCYSISSQCSLPSFLKTQGTGLPVWRRYQTLYLRRTKHFLCLLEGSLERMELFQLGLGEYILQQGSRFGRSTLEVSQSWSYKLQKVVGLRQTSNC